MHQRLSISQNAAARVMCGAMLLSPLACGPVRADDVATPAATQTPGPALVLEPARDGSGRILPVEHSDAQWRAILSEDAFEVLRRHGTERPFTSPLLEEDRDGLYACASCGLVLFESDTKFKSGTGWPSFTEPIGDHVSDHVDRSFGMVRTENRCARCDGHLGHVFEDGPPPTGLRYCINGDALHFVAEDASIPEG